MHSGTWAAVHLSGNGDQVHRIIQNWEEVQKMQTVFGAVQAQIKNLRLQNEELHGVSEKSGLDKKGHWSKMCVTSWTKVGATHIKSLHLQRISSLPGRDKASHIHTQPNTFEKGRIRYFVETPENRELQDMAGEPVEFTTFEEIQKMLADENLQRSQKAGASSCSMCNDINW